MLTLHNADRDSDQKQLAEPAPPPPDTLPPDTLLTGTLPALSWVLGALRPVSPVGQAKLRVGAAGDGGYVMLDELDGVGVCYSLGIGPDVSWDLAMAARGATIYQYDHTVPRPPVAHPRFRHARTGIAAEDGPGTGFRRLDTLLRQNGHADRDDMVLKVDIEGHEWEALNALDAGIFAQFRQVLVEFHGLRLLGLPTFLQRAHSLLAKLRQHHEVIHLHGNNFSGLRNVRGLMIPDCVEVSFANKHRYRFVPSREPLPGPLDVPNNPALPDLPLDIFTSPTAPTVLGDAPAADAWPYRGQDPQADLASIMADGDTSTPGAVIAVPDYVLAAARQEMDRIAALYRPAAPVSAVYRLSPALLDQAEALLDPSDRGTTAGIGPGATPPSLAGAIRQLRDQMADPAWRVDQSAASIGAVTLVTAALHFAAAWRHHPAFPAMLATAAGSGFSLHGLAAFAAAHCTAMRGIPVSFDSQQDPRGRIDSFTFPTGQASAAAAHIAILDGRERPTALGGSVRTRIEAARARINERHPGILVLSPGSVPLDTERFLETALQQAVQTAGRKNKGLLAVASIVPRVGPGSQQREVSFSYGFMMVPNPAAARGRQPNAP
jgi:hypothetical protein